MNAETEQDGQTLCSIQLHRRDGKRRLVAEIGHPQLFITRPPLAPEPVEDWGCMIAFSLDGVRQQKMVYSVSWLSSFFLALEYIRTLIPEGEEREWVDNDRVDSWCVLPRFVPFSWGYEVYGPIARMVEEEERKFMEEVDRRRLLSESKRKAEKK